MKVIDSIQVGKTPSGIAFNKKYNYLILLIEMQILLKYTIENTI